MPVIGVVPSAKVNVTSVMVAGSIGSLKVAVTVLLSGTPVALSNGSVEMTVGGIVSVVNDHT